MWIITSKNISFQRCLYLKIQHSQDGSALVCIHSTSASDSTARSACRRRRNCSVCFCPRPRNISGLWRQHEDTCLEGGVQLFRGAAVTPQHSFVGYEASLCVVRRVIGFVSPWLRQCHTRRHHGSVDGQIAVRAQRVCAADLRFP